MNARAPHIADTEEFTPVSLQTPRGDIEARLNQAGGDTAFLCVPGAIGGWHSPAHGLYTRLSKELREQKISSLQVKFRDPHDMAEATYDVLVGLEFLASEDIKRVALIGHSFGGAVVILAASQHRLARTIVALSPQTYGAIPAIEEVAPECSIMLIHGLDDEVLTPHCSRQIHNAAKTPKKLHLLPDTRHGLDEAADEVYRLTHDWIVSELAEGTRRARRKG